MPHVGSKIEFQGAWVARSVTCPTSSRVMIWHFTSLSPALGSLLLAWSPLRILCLPLSLTLSHCHKHCLSLSLSKINKHFKKFFNRIPMEGEDKELGFSVTRSA